MLIGGYNLSVPFMPSVEIYNADTKQSKMDPKLLEYGLKSHSGGVLNGVPVICGGVKSTTEYSFKCYEFIDGSWTNGVKKPFHSPVIITTSIFMFLFYRVFLTYQSTVALLAMQL